MEEKIVNWSFFTTEWKKLVPMLWYRWKISSSSSYIRCDLDDGIDLAQGACKLRMNVHSLCNMGFISPCLATACFTRRQCGGMDEQGIIHQFWAGKCCSHLYSIHMTSEASPTSYSVCSQGKVAGEWSKSLISIYYHD